jgi:DNA polymerase-3 subunit delta
MKLAPSGVEAFLRAPGSARLVLLYGDDVGLIRERANALVSLIAGTRDDPFRVVELAREDAASLADEAASLPMTGGRRVVRVRDVTDAALAPVRAVMKSAAPGFVVLEAAGLGPRSRLAQEIDRGPDDAVSVGCYPEEGRALEATIRASLKDAGVSIDPDALSWLAGQLGADRAATRAELEKLALYAGQNGRVNLDTAMACVGDLSGLSLDDALFAATVGDVATVDRALELAVAEGAAPVQVIRAAIGHMQRLQRARVAIDEAGLSAADATKAQRPPLFFRRVGAFNRALGMWSGVSIAAAINGLMEAERGCKRTGWPDNTLCRAAILVVARRAAATVANRNH